MNLAPIHRLRSSFTPVVHAPVVRAPIERVQRSAVLLGAPPHQAVTTHSAGADALSGSAAASIDQAPDIPLLAPGARFDAYA